MFAQMIWFSLASLTPVALLVAACLFGGIWPLVALFYVTGFVLALDRLAHRALPADDRPQTRRRADILSVVLGLAQLGLLPLGVWALAAAPHLTGLNAVITGVAMGLFFGQVSNSNAHELIHRAARWPRRLGKAVYISLLFGHHASAHPRVHHVYVASDRDPNSARSGEGFYRFWPRAWVGSFRAGLRAETALRRRAAQPPLMLSHPYVAYCGGAVLMIALAYGLAGLGGILVLMALTGYAQMQLLVSDYVQHYGLRRAAAADGTLEPAGPQHSWNAPHWYSAAMMLNAPRHSDHHTNPSRPFPGLRLDADTMPMLPHSLPVMGAIALCPPLWRRMMDPRAARWRGKPPISKRRDGGGTVNLAS
jgi:alkane 1-monooxygenase